MALKATIFKVELSITDMDRNVFENFSLTLARHPSENDARMMVRLLAFISTRMSVSNSAKVYRRMKKPTSG